MKATHLLPALLLLPRLAFANHESITDAAGSVAPLTVALTLSESIGGHAVSATKKEAEAARGVTYPGFTTFSTTYTPDAPVPATDNPFGWSNPAVDNYVERVTTNARNPERPVVTAAGAHKISRSRYTNATLLADLVASGKIPSAAGYRIVLVRFELDHEVHYMTAAGYNTHVNDHCYFYAEKGPADPAPVFLGAEYNDVYIYNQIVGLTRVSEIKAGKYSDTFTGDPVEGGFDYALASQNYTHTAAGEFFFFRPTASADSFYKITANGLYTWNERYDKKSDAFLAGPLNSSGIVGPAQGYFGVADPDHPGTFHEYTANGGNQAVVTGTIRTTAATRFASMTKYLDQIPNVMPH